MPEAVGKRKKDVFSVDEWEVGMAQGVEHHIRLSDPRPFSEGSRHIALADIVDVRRCLKDLLAAIDKCQFCQSEICRANCFYSQYGT